MKWYGLKNEERNEIVTITITTDYCSSCNRHEVIFCAGFKNEVPFLVPDKITLEENIENWKQGNEIPDSDPYRPLLNGEVVVEDLIIYEVEI